MRANKRKLEAIQLLNGTLNNITNLNNWQNFLKTAAWNYKYNFLEQIMIYAQKPKATACASIEVWNNKLYRYVNKGAKGIALLNDNGYNNYKMTFVFDASDTNSREHKGIRLWGYNDKYNDEIIDFLENKYGKLPENISITDAVICSAQYAVEANKRSYLERIYDKKDKSFLKVLPKDEIDEKFQIIAECSVAYQVLYRLGLEPMELDEMFDEQFRDVLNFNSFEILTILGDAISDTSEEILKNIHSEIKILNYPENGTLNVYNKDKDKNYERNDIYVNGDTVPSRGGLLSIGFSDAGRTGETDRQVRQNEEGFAEGERSSRIFGVEHEVGSIRTYGRDRRESEQPLGGINQADGESRGSNRGTQGEQSVRVGWSDEQHKAESRRNRNSGDSSQLSFLPTVDEQLDIIKEAEEQKSSAFLMPENREIADYEIDEILIGYGSGFSKGKFRIYNYFKENKELRGRAEFLKKEYGIGGFADGTYHFDSSGKGIEICRSKNLDNKVSLSWSKTAKRIANLIDDERYLKNTKIELQKCGDFYEAYDNDAKVLADVLLLTVAEKEIDKIKTPIVGFPDFCLEKYSAEIADLGISFSVNEAELLENQVDESDKIETTEVEEIVEDYSLYIGVEISANDRKFVVDSINAKTGSVSLRDVTFQNNTGFPIFRGENIEWLKYALKDVKIDKNAAKNNFVITDNNLGYGTLSEKFKANISAIKTLKLIEGEHRLATSEEQEILSRYVGWGGLADCFDEKHAGYGELKHLLTDEEYVAARASTMTAFYTPPIVIKSMYNALSELGFKEGNVLDPACGIFNFHGMLPESMSNSKMYGVELDSISGRISKQLYQTANVQVCGFENAELEDSFFDVAIGNVPFGQFKVVDKKYDKHNFLIHDYFFTKALDKVRPGGVVAFITSSGTMDKKSPEIRKYLAERAELLGAIRLPDNTFKANAGTEVTSDIIFLQKRERMIAVEPDWVHLNIDENGITMNQYFIDNPDMVLGEMVVESGPYGPKTACKAYEGKELEELLQNAIKNIHGNYEEYEIENTSDEDVPGVVTIPADPNVKNFSYTLVDDEVYYRENSRMTKVELSDKAFSRTKGMIEIRDCVRQLIDYQLNDYSDIEIKRHQEKLNSIYDDFVKENGRINSRGNASAFSGDNSYFLLCSLENIDENGEFKSKADIFTKRTVKPNKEIISVDTSTEALAVSLAEKAKVDIEFMSSLTGKDEDEIAIDLQGVIFLNPFYDENAKYELYPKYLTADEYLSGNVREKLKVAKMKAEADEVFNINVEALERVQPEDLGPADISVRLGATWISPEDIKEFVFDLLQPPYWARGQIEVHYSNLTGEWRIEGKSYDRANVVANKTYGTSRINAYKIIEETLNLKDVKIHDYIDNGNGGKTQVLNQKETTVAQQKQTAIKAQFQEWIWKEQERRERLVTLYNEKFNLIRPREYDGSHINFNGMNPEIVLRQHQKNAVARIMYGGNSLLAHVVGAGKTWTMAAAAMESKRLGLCNKPLFVVPNHLTEQWAVEFLKLYPAANILVATKKDFETKNRKRFCGRIATGDYDAVIIGHSQFEKIPLSAERQRIELERQRDEVIEGIADLKASQTENFTIKQMERLRKNLDTKLEKLNDQSRKDDIVTFEELGVDRIFVDEAHYYKNLFMYSKMRNVGGVAQTEAQKSSDLFMKCRYLDEITGGKGNIFATGTPISNSMVEMYTMQRYLQYNMLERNGLSHFDSWASTFGETVTAIELAPEGTGYRTKTRFAKFFNLPELMAMFKNMADVQTADMLKLPVPNAEYITVKTKPSETQKEMVGALAERAKKVRNREVDPTKDNMLKITNDGRKLALDQRLINPMLPDEENSKVNTCIDNVYNIWRDGAEDKLTQIVFCDLSTPKSDDTFSVYNDIRDKLIFKGVPGKEIAFIHDANSEAKKKELFAKVRNGDVRVLLGSTAKCGAGTNVQDRLIAIHDLDCPWRPADLEQRAGRIVRQGNMDENVKIFRYVTEQTFDAYLYQLIENKQKFISQIMTSKTPVRSAEDIDEAVLSYAEIKAIATGNPFIKEKMNLDIEVAKLKVLRTNYLNSKYALENAIAKEYPKRIATLKERIHGYESDIANTAIASDFVIEIDGKTYDNKEEAGKAIIIACSKVSGKESLNIGTYRGFNMMLKFKYLESQHILELSKQMKYEVELGESLLGNITRIDNAIKSIENSLNNAKMLLSETERQFENAKIEVKKPFEQEEELAQSSKRLEELNVLLNEDDKQNNDNGNENADDLEPDM